MQLVSKGEYKFFVRESPLFDDEWVVNEIWDTDCYRLKPEMFSGGAIVDIGANIGDFSIHASQYGEVYAYEPEPNNWRQLMMNININKDVVKNTVHPINLGVSKKGSFTINNHSGHSQVLEGEGDSVCRCIDLNEALKDFESIDLLKFDIEGSEYELFENATDETMKKIKRITGELHSWRWDDVKRHQALLDKLDKYFKCERWGYLDSNIAGVKW